MGEQARRVGFRVATHEHELAPAPRGQRRRDVLRNGGFADAAFPVKGNLAQARGGLPGGGRLSDGGGLFGGRGGLRSEEGWLRDAFNVASDDTFAACRKAVGKPD